MKAPKKLWLSDDWYAFSHKVKSRDSYRCLQCQRSSGEVVLQVHHEFYIPGKAPWEYSISDCRTLCKGCHAKEHGLIEPDVGWTLISIDDLGAPTGTCERKGCGRDIQYEHLTYHPSWGYKTVGSKCIEHLTKEDKLLSNKILKVYSKISKFVHSSEWYNGKTKNRKAFEEIVFNHHKLRIYGQNGNYAYQVILKIKGERFYDFQKTTPVKGKNLEQAKEIGYVVLKGKTTSDSEEKEILRSLYKALINST